MRGEPPTEDAVGFVPDGPAILLPVLGLIWLVLPVASSAFFGASDWGVTIIYLWAWSIIVPALVLGIGALVIRYRYGRGGISWRKRLWYWIAIIYAVGAVPVLIILL